MVVPRDMLEGDGGSGPFFSFISVNPTSCAFGDVTIGLSPTMDVEVFNEGSIPTTVTISTSGLGFTTAIVAGSNVNLAPGDSFTMRITFTPTSAVAYNEVILLTGSFINSPIYIPLSGTGVASGSAILLIAPGLWDFGDRKITTTSPEKLFSLTNVGTVAFDISALNYTAPFVAGATQPTLPYTVNPGNGVAVGVAFAPTINQFYSEPTGLEIVGTFLGSPVSVLLQGNGVIIIPAFTVGGTGELLAAFTDSTPLIKRFDPNDLNCEEPALFERAHDFGLPGVEKTLMRLLLQYESLGFSQVTVTITTNRQTVVAVVNTSAATNQALRRLFANVRIKDEIIKITVSRVGSAGPLSISEIFPWIAPGGEIVE